MKRYNLIVTSDADGHLDHILEYGSAQWGYPAAIRYYREILKHFNTLCENPFLYQAVPEIRAGYRRSVCGKHTVYYRINGETVEIMAVLRHEDPADYFSDDTPAV